MKIIRVVDKYNPLKVWVIKRYKCGHYVWNQEIAGRLKGKFIRTTKHWIQEVLGGIEL